MQNMLPSVRFLGGTQLYLHDLVTVPQSTVTVCRVRDLQLSICVD